MLGMWMNWTLVQKLKCFYNIWGKLETEDGSDATLSLNVSTLKSPYFDYTRIRRPVKNSQKLSFYTVPFQCATVLSSKPVETGLIWDNQVKQKINNNNSEPGIDIISRVCITLCTGNF